MARRTLLSPTSFPVACEQQPVEVDFATLHRLQGRLGAGLRSEPDERQILASCAHVAHLNVTEAHHLLLEA
eukprot:CAMPEP_0194517792 /NCGR_PEP_ID=MMETSP0253-20130528/51052_1 /TAXON_ID=2966 /ORGANISM="Noctiluca scintillans" /LENGTH=70 /DNA_ID=CAMNT_0039361787 /DNA_START=320 /DNA_END=532 /DNA_ORIENTATION=-